MNGTIITVGMTAIVMVRVLIVLPIRSFGPLNTFGIPVAVAGTGIILVDI